MNNYLHLLAKIDRFATAVRQRHPQAFACQPGCADCCVAGITVWRVERDHIGQFVRAKPVETRSVRPSTSSGRAEGCPFLDADRRCAIYDRRPVVCRLWGMPQLQDGKVSCCDRNFRGEAKLEALAATDLVDMEVVLSALAAINHVYCTRGGFDPTERFALAP